MKRTFYLLLVICALMVTARVAHAFYDPTVGRFLSMDPIDNNKGESPYTYCEGDPLNKIDPDGRTVKFTGAPTEFASTVQQIGFLKQNSPTFATAYNGMINSNATYKINPIPYSTGGQTSGTDVTWGTHMITPMLDGSTNYSVYTLAHEVGHANDFQNLLTFNNKGYTGDYTGLAPNAAEAYAWNFSNRVAQEVKDRTGQDIGMESNYWGKGDYGPDDWSRIGPDYPGGPDPSQPGTKKAGCPFK